jgi:16S rRNA (guanine527-N7)-methyltransferase
VVVSRAVAEMRVLSEYCLPFVKQGGYFLAYKGPGADEELKDAQNALKILGGEWVETRDIKVPFSDKTHKIIVIKKKSKTPKQYPRSAGKPKKFPL